MDYEVDLKRRFAASYTSIRASNTGGAPFIGPGDYRYDGFMGIQAGSEIGTSPMSRIMIYRRAIWVYACVEAKAVPMSIVPIKLYHRTPDNHHNEIFNHPILKVLENVNPDWDTASTIRYDTETSLNIHGRFQWLKVRNMAGIVKELYGLPVQNTQVIPSNERGQRIKVFRYEPYQHAREDYKPEDVIYFRYATPEQSVDGLSPLQVAIETTRADIAVGVAQNAMATNAARPSALITVRPKWSEADYTRISEELNRKYAGASNAGKMMLIDNADNVHVEKIQLNPKEMEWIKEHESHAQDICVAFRVPPMIANDFSDAARLANAGAGHRFYWENTLIPECRRWEDVLNWQLLWTEDWGRGGEKDANGVWHSAEYYDGMYLEHDLTSIQALREDENARAIRAQNAFGYGASVDEIRQMRGQDPLDDPRQGSVILVPNNLITLDVALATANALTDVASDSSGSNLTQTEAQDNDRGNKTGSSSLKTDLRLDNDVTNKSRQENMKAGAEPAIRSELRKWKDVYKKDPIRALKFTSDIIPQSIQNEIRSDLALDKVPNFDYNAANQDSKKKLILAPMWG